MVDTDGYLNGVTKKNSNFQRLTKLKLLKKINKLNKLIKKWSKLVFKPQL